MEIAIVVKIIGSILVISNCFLVGKYMGLKQDERLKGLYAIKTIFSMLKSEISYSISTLPEAFENVGRKNDSNLAQVLADIGIRLLKYDGENFAIVWEEEIRRKQKSLPYNKQDLESLISLGTSLISPDKKQQLNAIEIYLAQVDDAIAKLNETINDSKKLCNTMGLLVGIFLVVVLL